MKIRRSLLKDSVSVEPYAGQGAYGPVYTAPQTVSVALDHTRRLVRNSEGAEVVSEATLYVHPDDEARFPAQSRVTIAGRTSEVLATSPQTMRGQTVLVKVACS
jgi:hypothetical protein